MAFDAYLKIDAIPGEATDDAHKEWIQILSFEHEIAQPHGTMVAGGGARGGVERCEHEDFTITKHVDKASPKLNLHCCNGQNLKSVKIEVCRQVDKKIAYLTYTFDTCLIRSVGISGDSSEELPIETVKFSYAKLEWKYKQVDPKTNQDKGDTMANWDMLTNVGG